MGELPEGHALLPAQVVIPVLEKLPVVLADQEEQPYALHICVLGLPGGASDVMRGQGFYGPFGEGETLHGRPPFVGRSLGYSGDGGDGCSVGEALWDEQRKFRSRSGPEGKLRGLSGGGEETTRRVLKP